MPRTCTVRHAPGQSVLRRLRYATLFAATFLAAAASPAHAQFPPDSFTNLRVLPSDIQPGTLVELMAGFTRALGVRCTFCHVGEEGMPLAGYDFAADDKPTKRKARIMIEMVGSINDSHLAGLEERTSPAVDVQCMTCHRGVSQPRMLQDILENAVAAGGVDSAVAIYGNLRQRYYGRMAYDFGAVPLADVARQLSVQGRFADAERLLELNLDMNPASDFARLQFVAGALVRTFTESGPYAGRSRYRELKARFGVDAFAERVLNGLGYTLLRGEHVPAAVTVFELNVEEYPASANTYDSLGEALAASGDIEGAIRNYERSLELDPRNTNAVEKLRELHRRGRGRR